MDEIDGSGSDVRHTDAPPDHSADFQGFRGPELDLAGMCQEYKGR